MPQTFMGWILLTSTLLSGMGGAFMAAVMLDDVLGDGTVQRRDLVAAAVFGALLLTSGLLLAFVEGR